MALQTNQSFAVSTLLAILLFSGMQMYKQCLTSSQPLIIFSGFLGSVLFMLVLTAVGNLEAALFGKGVQLKLFPEVILCLGIALTASGMVHRICTTVCLILSLVHLYYINIVSQRAHQLQVTNVQTFSSKKKK